MHIDCKYDNFFIDRSKFYKGSEKIAYMVW